jgi:hypothetical protein
METKDIIGKEITCFSFKPIDKLISYDGAYKSVEGKNATVLEINSSYPQYAEVKIGLSVGKSKKLHYPTAMIKEQLEQEENKSIDDILNDIKQLFLNI